MRRGVSHLVEGGVSGNLTTLEPQLSPMLWTSIATGKMAYHHGVEGFPEVGPVSVQVVPVSAATRLCKTDWALLGEPGPSTGEIAEVDHIVPVSKAPRFEVWIGNLEFMPRTLNRKKSD